MTPFVAALPGCDPLRDRELRGLGGGIRVTPQFIGKDPEALRECLLRVKDAGCETADLNCGCPFPMVRNKGRGSGMLRTPDVLRRMLDAGCEAMGPDRFSVKARLGVDDPDELLALMPLINQYPLRFLTVHARTARQMYSGECDAAALARVEAASAVRIVRNGDLGLDASDGMVGRAFVRSLGARDDSRDLLRRYVAASASELRGDRAVLGRIKELLSYWRELPQWRRKWPILKICRSTDEILAAI